MRVASHSNTWTPWTEPSWPSRYLDPMGIAQQMRACKAVGYLISTKWVLLWSIWRLPSIHRFCWSDSFDPDSTELVPRPSQHQVLGVASLIDQKWGVPDLTRLTLMDIRGNDSMTTTNDGLCGVCGFEFNCKTSSYIVHLLNSDSKRQDGKDGKWYMRTWPCSRTNDIPAIDFGSCGNYKTKSRIRTRKNSR